MEINRRRKKNKPRQEWNPHWILKLLYVMWSACFGAVKIALGAVATVAMICVVCMIVFVGTLGNYLQEDILPDATFNLENFDLDQTSFVYYVDSDGEIQRLQQIHTSTDRQWATLEEIPEDLVNAAIAIEDKRFYEHQGVDWITTVKACANLFFGGGSKFGGSTITQQFIKNQTGEDSVTVQRKVMEIFRAQQFEKVYDKDTVMEWYLNTIYLGRGCYGVKSAAAEYFGKELQNLTTAECASLISITNNPSIFNPYASTFEWDPGDDEGRREMTGAERNNVRKENTLWSMHDQGMLDDEEYEAALAQELVFKSGIDLADRLATCKSCGYSGIVSTYSNEGENYYCPSCGNEVSISQDNSQEVYSWFVDTVLEDVARDLAALSGVDYDSLDDDGQNNWMAIIQRGGYHIYSTLDMDVQEVVDSVYTDLSKIPTAKSKQQLQSGIVVINNETGDIVALSGGVGEKATHDAFNRATDAKLQTGSTQKPLSVYAPAFEVGAISPATVVTDLPISYAGGTSFPKNDNRSYSYSRTILSGIVSSVNAVSIHTLDKIGFDYAYTFAKDKFGQSNLTDHFENAAGEVKSDLGYSPLGMGALTVGASIREMSAAYATFANNGVYREARTYTKVYDSNGNLVLDNTQDSRQILSEKTVNYMNYCLYNAVESGTGTAAQISGQNVAGKTGTTSSNKDRWFCGYTGYYTAAVWCGYDNPEVIKLTGTKSNPAARLWKMVMEPIHSGLSRAAIYDSSSFRSYSVCLDSGDLASDACSKDTRVYEFSLKRTASAYAYKGDGPSGTCDKHVLVDYCSSGNGVATEYCSQFPGVEIVERSLVKMTKSEIDEIKAAGNYGLNSAYLDGSYVYYLDGDWHGFSGNANKGIEAPYLMCTEHTKEAWEAHQKAEQEKAEQEAAAQATEPVPAP
ncbi:MAG: transglycosylase domain-containing protein [Oscillospiraceae bacterium]|nr:transglycosylase domain-containing protein [Oscillospiraceae bacterium]